MSTQVVENYNYDTAKKLYSEIENDKPQKLPQNVFLHGLHYQDKSDNELSYVSLYITHKCQINCVYCSKHFDMLAVEEGKVIPLTPDEIYNFIRDAKRIGLKTLIIQGMAEPTEDPHFRDYISFADSLGITTIVFSNILNLDDDLAEFLYQHDVSLAPSVDTLNPEVYKAITQSNEDGRFLRAIEVLKRHFGGKNKWMAENTPRVMLSMVLTSYNVGDLQSIRDLCNEEDWLLCSKAFGVKGAAKENFPKLACDKEYYSLLQSLAMSFADKVMITQTSEGKCACGGSSGFLVDIDGTIGACGDMLTRVNANIRTDTIEKCLQAKKNYVSGLGNYTCLSKALRGFGDVNIKKA